MIRFGFHGEEGGGGTERKGSVLRKHVSGGGGKSPRVETGVDDGWGQTERNGMLWWGR